MVQPPDNRYPGTHRPEFDRTVIRPAGRPTRAPVESPSAGSAAAVSARKGGSASRPLLTYFALAVAFLVFGGGVGGVAHLLSTGAISFSAPKEIAVADLPDTSTELPGTSADTGSASKDADVAANASDRTPGAEEKPDLTAAPVNDEELDTPADPFFDMSVSAVISLAGDPVLLRGSEAGQRIELSERPVPDTSNRKGAAKLPVLAAFVLDSQMLNSEGELIIRAPGSETDFQFGNFGGGEDSEGLVIEEDEVADDNGARDLPVFLKPPADTLDLFLSERPIGQGPSRIEIQTRIEKPVSLKAFLKENGFDEDVSKGLIEFSQKEFLKGDLIVGDKIAVRGVRLPNKVGRVGDYYRPVQVSFHSADGYVGTAAYSPTRDGDTYVHGADPWFGKTIAQDKTPDDKSTQATKGYRLIDGLYATAVRNAVPASIVGEAIAYLAPMTDLKRTIKPDERFMLVFTAVSRDEKRGGGRVLFAGVRRGDKWSVRCYVLKAPGNRGFACVNEGGKVSLSGAMLVPVKGVLTSKFGPRFHPIKKTERLHAGVDWAAPTGTPIRAAFSGRVSYRDVRGGYGNFIELTHKDGITTRYAHMHEYGEGIQMGSVVQAGDLIGYVGTTGLSTGPHLHFEIRQRGTPTNPLDFEMETGADAPESIASSDLSDYRGLIGEILTGQ